MKKFEYCYIKSANMSPLLCNDKGIYKLNGELYDILHDLGKDHWEMVGIGNTIDTHTIYFKREIP
jgi:hypothetical protein